MPILLNSSDNFEVSYFASWNIKVFNFKQAEKLKSREMVKVKDEGLMMKDEG